MTETVNSNKKESWAQWAIGEVLASLEAIWGGLEEIGKSPESPTTSSELQPGQTIMQVETLKLICDYCDVQNPISESSCMACGAALPRKATNITQ